MTSPSVVTLMALLAASAATPARAPGPRLALVEARAGRARAGSGPEPFLEPVRCVADYLEALGAAAPARRSRAPARVASDASDPRWGRVRSYLSPRAVSALEATDRPQPLAPWSTLGGDGALLGYELLASRRAPLGAVVVVSRESTERAPGAGPVSSACAYLVGRVGAAWRIADKRCGRDFPNAEVSANYRGYWDEPVPGEAAPGPDEWFGDGLE